MSIITGGTKPNTQITTGGGPVDPAATSMSGGGNQGQVGASPAVSAKYRQNITKTIQQNDPGRGQGGSLSDFNQMKDMIEVKTSNNYKIGKSTINARIGEDYEPDKPIMVYNPG